MFWAELWRGIVRTENFARRDARRNRDLFFGARILKALVVPFALLLLAIPIPQIILIK
jgi:hypothetical protein